MKFHATEIESNLDLIEQCHALALLARFQTKQNPSLLHYPPLIYSHIVPNSSSLFMSNLSCPCRCTWENV